MAALQHKLSLDRPARYRITVPGQLDARWSSLVAQVTMVVEPDADGLPTTILTGTLDQAALLGLLRQLNRLGLPLIAVICLEVPGTCDAPC